MQKYITRTFNVKRGVKLEPEFSTRTFKEVEVVLIDEENPPSDVSIQTEEIVKVRMPLERFFNDGEKIMISR